MRLISTLALLISLAACSSFSNLPQPQTIPTLNQSGQWFKLERTDVSNNSMQSSLLAVEQTSEGIRFIQTNALGAPISRQIINHQGWKNDGFVVPNSDSRLLFAALLPLLATQNSTILYPKVKQQAVNKSFCQNDGALFRYQNHDLWCIAHQQQQFIITFPHFVRWTVSPIEE